MKILIKGIFASFPLASFGGITLGACLIYPYAGPLQFIPAWMLLSFGLVFLGYAGIGPGVLGKRKNGHIPVAMLLLHAPYHAYSWGVWFWKRLGDKSPPFQCLHEDIYIGRRIPESELPRNVTTVIDLTAEFPQKVTCVDYVSLPILDDATPSKAGLESLTETLRDRLGGVYIHCAEGKGRTALVASILLTELGVYCDWPLALELVQRVRPGSGVNPGQSKFAMAFCKQRQGHEKRRRI